MTYNTVPLSSICKGGGSYGIAASAVDYSPDLPTYIRITDINDDGTLNESGLKSVDDPNSVKYYLSPNDIVYARTGASTGRNYFYDGSDGKLVYAGFLIKFSIDPQKVNPLFIKYYCQTKDYYDWVGSFNTGSTRGNINAQTLGNMPIPLLLRDKQDLLADTLSVIDARIAENRKINHHLMKLAQTIFKSWFVDFEPWDGEMPDGWTYTTLNALCSLIAKGITPQYDESSAEIVINQKCIRNKAIDLSLSRRHRPKRINEKWLQYGDILINSTGEGTLGRVAQFFISESNFTVDSHITIVRPIEDELMFFLGQWCLQRESEFAAMASGSTGQTDLPRERLKAMECILPDAHTLLRFSQVIKPLVEMQAAAQLESARLATLRDTLLPRLMSGELSVVDLDDAK